MTHQNGTSTSQVGKEDVLESGLSQMAAGTIIRAQGFTKMKMLLKVTKNLLEQSARDSITNGEIDPMMYHTSLMK